MSDLQKCRISATTVTSFVGDVLPVYLTAEENLSLADIIWHIDGDTVTMQTFSGKDISANHGVLLALHRVGKAKVTAEYNGQTYSCDVVIRPRQEAGAKPLLHFLGDFHCHTSQDHNHDTFALDESGLENYVRKMKAEKNLDFTVITDHAVVTNPKVFFRGFVEPEINAPMDTVFFAGSESEVSPIEPDRFGNTRKNGGEVVCINNSRFITTDNWDTFIEAMKQAPAPVCVLAHPQVVGYDKNGIWNFSLHRNNTPDMLRMIKGVEMGNGTDRSSNALNEWTYSLALDCGFHVSPTCASDEHGPNWGFDAMPGKTVILAPEKSKEAFLDALLNNRFYATESGNVKLTYTVNGIPAPATLPLTDTYTFHVTLDTFRDDATCIPTVCRVISDEGETVHSVNNGGKDFSFTVKSDTARYFFLRLTDPQGRKTWSMPVFTGRAPSDHTPPVFPPLDKSRFRVTELTSGQDASILVNNDPSDAWESDLKTADLVIDMGEEKTVRAFGHYPPRFGMADLVAHNRQINEAVTHFACRYLLSTSTDGKNFTEKAKGVLRIFGAEEIIPMEEHTARYIRFEVLSTVGKESEYPALLDQTVHIAELSVF